MNILYINHYAGSVRHGMEFRPYYLGREWLKQGHQVSILGGSFSHLRQVNPTVPSDFTSEDVDGLNYTWLKVPQYSGNGVGRLINIFTFVLKLIFYTPKIIKMFKPQIVIASSTYPLDVIPAYIIAKITKAKLVHEVHDLWPLTLTEIGGMSRWNPFVILLQWAENFSYRKADSVVSMLEASFAYMAEHGLTKDRFLAIPNGIDEAEWLDAADIPQDLKQLCEQTREKKHFILGYTGHLGLANSVHTLIEAMVEVKDLNVSLILLGQGPAKADLIKECEKQGLKNVHFYGTVKKNQVPKFLEHVDATFIGAPKSSLYRFGVSPNKLLDYLMASRPIIYSIESGNNWVKEVNCGISTNAESSKEIAEAIRKLSQTPIEERNQMGLRGKNFVLSTKTYKHLSRRFLEFCTSGI